MKGFTDEERERIRGSLMAAGREQFGVQGLKKTSIQDLTRAASISTGAFYSFFDSKESLFFEILMEEYRGNEAGFKTVFMNTERPALMLRMLIDGSMEKFQESPIIRRMLDREETGLMYRKVGPEKKHELDAVTFDMLRDSLESWREKGIVIDESADLLATVITALYYLTLHREDIGTDRFPEVIRLLARFVADGITGTGTGKSAPGGANTGAPGGAPEE